MRQFINNLFIVVSIAIFSGYLLVSADTLNLKGEDKNTIVYSEEALEYTFKYPKSWNVYRIPDMSYLRVENIDARKLDSLEKNLSNQYFKIELVTLPSNGLSLTDWVERQNTTSYPLPKVLEQTSIEVAGQQAIYQVEQFGSLIHPAIFILKDDKIYIINISSSDESFKPIVDEFIGGLEFNQQNI